MSFEYKTVGAPERGKRQRGLRTGSDRVAAAFEEILRAEAVDGWEYLRTDLLPVTERAGWFSRAHEVHRAVMVFRRPRARVAAVESEAAVRPVLAAQPAPARPTRQEPEVGIDPDLRLAETVRGPDGSKPDG